MRDIRNDYIGIVVAVPEELRILKALLTDWTSGNLNGMRSALAYWCSHPVAIIMSGQGEENARKACQALYRQYHPRFTLSAGFCGALQLGMHIGDIVVSSRVIREKDALEAEKENKSVSSITCWKPTDVALSIAEEANNEYINIVGSQGISQSNKSQCWKNTIVTSSKVVCKSDDKLALSKLSGAAAVDMESAAVAEYSTVAGVHWLSVRVVSDVVNVDMPMDFNKFTDSNGNMCYLDIIKKAMSNPKMIPGLIRFGMDSYKASSNFNIYMQCLLKAIVEHEVE